MTENGAIKSLLDVGSLLGISAQLDIHFVIQNKFCYINNEVKNTSKVEPMYFGSCNYFKCHHA